MADTMILEIETLINKSLLEQTDKIIGAVGKQAQKTEDAISKMGGAFKGVAAMAATYLSVGQIIKGIDLASDFTENRNKLEAVFVGQVEDADKFINEMADSLNLGKRQLEKEMADVGAMIKGMGFEDTDLKGNTQAVLKAAKDVASFYNTDLDSAIRSVTSAINGEAESLKQLTGINLQETQMAEYFEKLTGEKWADLDNTAKAQVRLNAALEGMKKSGAAGDAEKTKDEYAAVERSIKSLVETITGDFFMSMKDSMLPALQETQEFLKNNKDEIVGFGEKLGEFVGVIITGVGAVTNFVSENSDLTMILGEVALVAGGLLGIYKTAVFLTETWAAVQAVLNGTMMLNPIGLVVAGIAGLVYFLYQAYQGSEQFRNMVDSVFGILKKGWEWLKESKLGQMFSKLFGSSEKGITLSQEEKKTNENINKSVEEVIDSKG
uniref:hypothetical protein n=1 Tax=uncultured Clostridium sp. TaxID=59620 RepID=UPI00260F0049